MFVSDERCLELLNKYGCDIDSVKSVNMGFSLNCANKTDKLATIGLGGCVAIVAHSLEFTYLSHIDVEGALVPSKNENNSTIKYKSVLELLQLVRKYSPKSITLGLVSREAYVYEEKFWQQGHKELYDEVAALEKIIEELGVSVVRIPNQRSHFVAIDSFDGKMFVASYGYAIETNINNLEEKKYLNSLDRARKILNIKDKDYKSNKFDYLKMIPLESELWTFRNYDSEKNMKMK